MEAMRFIEDKIKPRQTLSNVGLAADCEISVLTIDNEQLNFQRDENAGTFDTSTQGSTHSNTDLLRAYPPCEELGLPFPMDRWDSSQNNREKDIPSIPTRMEPGPRAYPAGSEIPKRVSTKRKSSSPNTEFHSKVLKELEKKPDTDMQWLSSLLPLLKEKKKKKERAKIKIHSQLVSILEEQESMQENQLQE